MPHCCCVPHCRSNYHGQPKMSVFKFPEDIDLRQKWIRAIPRENFKPTRASKVCLLHFSTSDIERETGMLDVKTGRWVSASLMHPRLAPNTVPSIFPESPSTKANSRSNRFQREKTLSGSVKEVENVNRMNFSILSELHEMLNVEPYIETEIYVEKPNEDSDSTVNPSEVTVKLENPDYSENSASTTFTPTFKPTTVSQKIKKRKLECIDKVTDAIEKLKEISTDGNIEDEFYYFGMNIAAQLKQLPLERALHTQIQILNFIAEERIALSEELLSNSQPATPPSPLTHSSETVPLQLQLLQQYAA